MVGLLLLAAPDAWATHVWGTYEGTHAQGGQVTFRVRSTYVSQFSAWSPLALKTELGQDCTPSFPPLSEFVDIVDHAFSDTTPPIAASGSFSAPNTASGTFRITTDSWYPPPMEPRRGTVCDSGTVSWTATCKVSLDSPCTPIAVEPTFSGSASPAKVSRSGRVRLPLRIGCPEPGGDCRVAVTAYPLTRVATVQGSLGGSRYRIATGRSAATRFELTRTGLRRLHRRKRMRVLIRIRVTRGGTPVASHEVKARLKAPST